MFLAAAFIAVFVLELTSGKRVHPVQYVLVGLSMILFYALCCRSPSTSASRSPI